MGLKTALIFFILVELKFFLPASLQKINVCGRIPDEYPFKSDEFDKSKMAYMDMRQLPNCDYDTQSGIEEEAIEEEDMEEEEERIIGASNVTSSDTFPWIASLSRFKNGTYEHICGAVILTEFLLLTAAHCVTRRAILYESLYLIKVGEYHQQLKEETEQEFILEKIIKHEHYFCGGDYHKNDIALLKIKPNNGSGITFTRHVQPVCLPSTNAPYKSNAKAIIGGWGKTNMTDKAGSMVLLMAQIHLMDWNRCKEIFELMNWPIYEGMTCAGYIEGISEKVTDACQGDSGGPMVSLINDRAVLYGLVSWGFGCGNATIPGVYTNVQYYLPWILENMMKLCN